MLQSYILSTTTETFRYQCQKHKRHGFNRTSFQQQLKPAKPSRINISAVPLQSYILSTTTETRMVTFRQVAERGFNRTSFQQQLKPNSPLRFFGGVPLQSYILSTTTETPNKPPRTLETSDLKRLNSPKTVRLRANQWTSL